MALLDSNHSLHDVSTLTLHYCLALFRLPPNWIPAGARLAVSLYLHYTLNASPLDYSRENTHERPLACSGVHHRTLQELSSPSSSTHQASKHSSYASQYFPELHHLPTLIPPSHTRPHTSPTSIDPTHTDWFQIQHAHTNTQGCSLPPCLLTKQPLQWWEPSTLFSHRGQRGIRTHRQAKTVSAGPPHPSAGKEVSQPFIPPASSLPYPQLSIHFRSHSAFGASCNQSPPKAVSSLLSL